MRQPGIAGCTSRLWFALASLPHWLPDTGQTSCGNADAGYYIDATGSSGQTPCAIGTYQPDAGQTSCLDADAGYYVDSTAQTSQTECAAGTYQASTGQSSCTHLFNFIQDNVSKKILDTKKKLDLSTFIINMNINQQNRS